MAVPLEVFCCYAREDQEMLKHLKKHLMSLQRSGQITVWSDTNLSAGAEWEKELHQHLESADIILLLISPDFMSSDYCYSTEMGRAIERHNEGNTRVVPILIRPVHWDNAPFAKIHMIPTNAIPVTKWLDHDDAFHDVTGYIKYLVSELQSQLFLTEADAHSSAEQYREALVSYEQVLSLNPTNGLALFGRARMLHQLGNINASIEAFTIAKQIAFHAGNVTSALAQADALKQRELYIDSLAAYDWALSLDPNNGGIRAERATLLIQVKEPWLKKGKELYNAGLYNEALAAYEQVIHLDPNDNNIYNSKGDALYELNRYEQAIVVYEQAIRLNPNNAIVHEHKGMALDRLNRYEEAVVAYEQAIHLDPNNVIVHEHKGMALGKLNRYEEAVVAYEQAIRLDPNNVIVHEHKGMALDRLNRYEEAVRAYEEAIRLDPNNAVVYEYKGNALYEMHRYEEAIAAYEEAIRLDPNFDEAYIFKGITLYLLRRYEEAVRAYEEAIRLDPNNLTVINNFKERALEQLSRQIEKLDTGEPG